MFKQDYDLTIVANNQIPATREIRKLRNQEVLAIMAQVQVDQNGQVPAHLRPIYRQVLLDSEQPEDVIEAALGEESPQMNQGEDDTEVRSMIERMGYNPDELMGGNKGRVINRAGSQKAPVENPMRSDMQKTSQNLMKY